jgi:hypothetical protein
MIHKYGTAYPYFTKQVPTYAMKCHDKLDSDQIIDLTCCQKNQ